MVAHNRCRYCGGLLLKDIPQLFAPAPQRIFEYIWDHPGTISNEIMMAIYGQDTYTNVVSVHISAIRRGLMDTEYQLLSLRPSMLQGQLRKTKRPRRYYIKLRGTTELVKEPANVTV